MKKDKNINTKSGNKGGQLPDNKTRADIKHQQTDNFNPNHGPLQRSKKKTQGNKPE
jgi:hypothetical protein